MRKVYHEKVGRHSKPGLVAGPKREFQKQEWQYLLDRAEGKLLEITDRDLEYDFGDSEFLCVFGCFWQVYESGCVEFRWVRPFSWGGIR